MRLSVDPSLRFNLFLAISAIAIPLSLFSAKALVPLLVLLWLSAPRLKPVRPGAIAFVTLALIGWALLESFRMAVVPRALLLWGQMVLLVIFGSACLGTFSGLEDDQKRRFAWVITGSVVLTLLLSVVDLLGNDILTRSFRAVFTSGTKKPEINMLNRGACFLSLAIWPAMLGVARLWPQRLYLPPLLWGVAFAVLSQLESMSATLAILAGTIAFVWVKFTRSPWNYAVAAGVGLVMLFTPLAMLQLDPEGITASRPSLPASTVHRLHIWKFASHKALENPVLGLGFNASPFIMEARRNIVVNGREVPGSEYIPGHPHNSILQLWLELGFPGVLLYTLLAMLIFTGILRDKRFSPSAQAAFTAVLVGYAIIGMTAFGIWQQWWMAAGFFAAIFTRALGYLPSSALASAQKDAISSDSGRRVGSMPA